MKRENPKKPGADGPESPLTAILQALRQAPEPLSGESLAARLGLSRAAVWKRINRLKAQGYAIVGSPRRGYRLLDQAYLLQGTARRHSGRASRRLAHGQQHRSQH